MITLNNNDADFILKEVRDVLKNVEEVTDEAINESATLKTSADVIYKKLVAQNKNTKQNDKDYQDMCTSFDNAQKEFNATRNEKREIYYKIIELLTFGSEVKNG